MARGLRSLLELAQTAAVSLVRMIGAAAAFALAAVVSSALGPADAGVFFVSITWAYVIGVVARWGSSDLIVLTIAPMAHGKRASAIPAIVARRMYEALFRFAAMVLPGLVAVWALVDRLVPQPLALDPWFILPLALAITLQQLLSATARAFSRPVVSSFLEFSFMSLFTLAGYLLCHGLGMALKLQHFEWLYTVGAIVATFLLLAGSPVRIAWLRPIRASLTRSTAYRAHSFALIELCNYLLVWASFLMMPFLLPAADVGIFNAVQRIAGIVQLVTVNIPLVFLPKLAIAQRQRDQAEFGRLLRSMQGVMLATGLGFFVAVAILGGSALSLFGAEFAAGYIPLLITTAGLCASLALGPAGALLSVRGHEHIFRNVTIAAGLAAIVLSIPAIWWFGLAGAASVTGLTALGSKLALVHYSRVLQAQDVRMP
jgi:O-antigen/teichoic acid export membrane protein